MDSALYTLLGALGGILITQVANYFLEDKKSKNLIKIKILDLAQQNHHQLLKERRIAYSKYLESVDLFWGKKTDGMADIMGDYYSALIISSDKTALKIRAVLTILKAIDVDVESFLSAKRDLLESMQNDMQV